MKIWIAAALLLVSVHWAAADQPLASPGTADFRAALIAKVMGGFATSPQFDQVPRKVKYAFAECSADYILAGLSPNDRGKLDAFANGSRTMTADEYAAIGKTIDGRLSAIGGDQELALQNLATVCPASNEDFRRYFLKP